MVDKIFASATEAADFIGATRKTIVGWIEAGARPALNVDAWEFSDAIRKRCLMVYANRGIPEDDTELKSRLEAEAKAIHNGIGTAFYAEYLARMDERLRHMSPGSWLKFDYLPESTRLIREMLQETRQEGESLPAWCKVIGWREYDDAAGDLKRRQVRARLAAEALTAEYPPPPGFWTRKGDEIFIGVGDYRIALRNKAIPTQIVRMGSSHGGNLALSKEDTVAMLKRGDASYELPELQPGPEQEPEKPGLFSRLKAALH